MTLSPCLQDALSNYPAEGQAVLAPLLDDPSFAGVIPAQAITLLGKITGLGAPQVAQTLVPFATCLADPPISQFHVGVVALGMSGAAYFGGNMEYPGAALPFTVHGEQSATVNAWTNGEPGLTDIAISAAPCGYCRQFLYELTTAADLTAWLDGQQPVSLSPGLLPDAFGPSDLGVTAALMTPGVDHGLVVDGGTSDPVVLAALDAANQSYAPYTMTYAGVALACADGSVFAGRLAENAAYNPSMSPMEGALNLWSLAGQVSPVTRVVLVEAQRMGVSLPSQVSATQALVDTYGGVVTFDVVAAVPGGA